ncbi:SOS-induced cell division inhibitor SulA [Phytopseudomonas dryadis]|uniref:CDP-glycerol--UDP-pyrophosphoryl-N-acetylglucosaminyl-N-acetylmannosamine glycerophosphotransferase n=1 Tax=Phytopseudomonas dryadis TaxID=2487520 RepID=A0A4Q9R278_9GAMM|nr:MULTISPECIES: SOS-induced cell division inhibitor SulA [Pseudomonas]TBU93378.1 CDP-glycerol--UDP-pyrophosphoryl-N-acetylglucosaminyl-N-acetylmannosamine glycerophosphotransferase [Pseudomonas dryadis]TBV07114.1 CDP-glycerol--UDP-pyrophosphoryl-N-acetylglucosaminyl-N-acetylmannosamine glycerophosphotransferase [Pseudomonas dryadis]TBV19492.1 CDP-glycerol--UDP-pyrophosphoryl-N-acetylglucosaminyl-N-acetylmannosamine glycerophosphotransferase [Pseudomonas sp. FRB 230]
MQFPQSLSRTQLPLFEAFLASTAPLAEKALIPDEPQAFSEISLRGAAGHCLTLLAPMLRELSEGNDERWLSLIAPPSSLTQAWLRDAGLNRERILLLHPRGAQSALQLAQEALKLGRSHTVVSWLHPLEQPARQLLERAARQGQAQSLNISLG